MAGSLRLPRRLVAILEVRGCSTTSPRSCSTRSRSRSRRWSGERSPARPRRWACSRCPRWSASGSASRPGSSAGRPRSGRLDEPTLQTLLTLLVPFLTYVVADELARQRRARGADHGVLPGFVLWPRTRQLSVGRLTGRSFWEVVDSLVVTGVAFGVIGLELHHVLRYGDRARAGTDARRRGGRGGRGRGRAYGCSGCCPRPGSPGGCTRTRDYDEEIPVSWRETVVMWWAGMRRVASVALALAIPLKTDDGSPFPGREEIVFIAFAVIMTTLVFQGLTLPWLVRKLGVRPDTDAERGLERDLAIRAAKAAKRRLKEIEDVEELPEDVMEQLMRRAYDVGARISPDMVDEERRASYAKRVERIRAVQRIQREMMSAARHEVLAARSEPGADPEVVDRVLRHLDVRSLR